jgi:hypothetical protein
MILAYNWDADVQPTDATAEESARGYLTYWRMNRR